MCGERCVTVLDVSAFYRAVSISFPHFFTAFDREIAAADRGSCPNQEPRRQQGGAIRWSGEGQSRVYLPGTTGDGTGDGASFPDGACAPPVLDSPGSWGTGPAVPEPLLSQPIPPKAQPMMTAANSRPMPSRLIASFLSPHHHRRSSVV
jgi:hypothetical protein